MDHDFEVRGKILVVGVEEGQKDEPLYNKGVLVFKDGHPEFLKQDSKMRYYHYLDDTNATDILKAIETVSQTTTEREEFVYSNGQLLEKHFLINGKKIGTIYFFYDDQGRLVRENFEDTVRIYAYDQKGQKVKSTVYRQKQIISTKKRLYDENGKVIECLEEAPQGVLFRLHTYGYDDNDLINYRQSVNGDKMILEEVRYEYPVFHEENWLERIAFRTRTPNGIPCGDFDSVTRRVFVTNHQNAFNDLFPEQTLKKDNGRYTGDIRDGRMEGCGTFHFDDGCFYKGSFHNDRMEGYGVFEWPDGHSYHGKFIDNVMEGTGKCYRPDGSFSIRKFHDGTMTESSRQSTYI